MRHFHWSLPVKKAWLKKQRIEKQRVIDRLTGRLTALRASDAATRSLMAVERNSMALTKAVEEHEGLQGYKRS